MTRRSIPLLLSLLVAAGCPGPVFKIGQLPDEVNCIAVVPFDVRFDPESTDEMLSEFLALDLYRGGAHGVLGPRELVTLYRAARDPLPPSIDPYWARTVGKRLGVDGVVFGAVSRLPLYRSGKIANDQVQLVLDVYLLNVRSGEIRWSYGTREVVDSEAMIPRLNRYSEWMAASLLGNRVGVIGQRGCWKTPREVAETRVEPAPPKKPAVTEVPLTPGQTAVRTAITQRAGFLMDGSIFDGRTERLTKSAIPLLREAAAVLKSSKAPRRTQIAAHVDATENSADDLRLSKLRAEEVRKYLESLGVPAQRLEAAGYGGSQPQIPNLNQRSRELNRRTILVLVDPPAGK